MYCKRVCQSYKARKSKYSASYYDEGHKLCVQCEIFLQWHDMRCPCCNHVLRTRPHNTSCKQKLRLKQSHYNY